MSIVAIAPASLLGSIMLLLLRAHTPPGRTARAFTAASVAIATVPLIAFLLGDPFVIAGCASLVGVLVFLILEPEGQTLLQDESDLATRPALARDDLGGPGVPAAAGPRPATVTARSPAAYADPQFEARLQAIAERAADLLAFTTRLQLNGPGDGRNPPTSNRTPAAPPEENEPLTAPGTPGSPRVDNLTGEIQLITANATCLSPRGRDNGHVPIPAARASD